MTAPAVTRPRCERHPNFYDSGCPRCADEADGIGAGRSHGGRGRQSHATTESELREAVGLLCEMLGAGRNEDNVSKAVHAKARAWLVEKGHIRG